MFGTLSWINKGRLLQILGLNLVHEHDSSPCTEIAIQSPNFVNCEFSMVVTTYLWRVPVCYLTRLLDYVLIAGERVVKFRNDSTRPFLKVTPLLTNDCRLPEENRQILLNFQYCLHLCLIRKYKNCTIPVWSMFLLKLYHDHFAVSE